MDSEEEQDYNEQEEEEEEEECECKEEFMDKDGCCDVSAKLPPGINNPLPPFGELFRKRYEQHKRLKPRYVPKTPRIYRGNDLLWICKEAKNLFRPHGLPQQIAKIPSFVTYSDGLMLREICKQVREQHWSYICLRKNQFRERIWQLMHVERIPCGNLRESFVYSFQTYMPEKPHLPIIKNNPLPW